jgi:hypothetical protein
MAIVNVTTMVNASCAVWNTSSSTNMLHLLTAVAADKGSTALVFDVTVMLWYLQVMARLDKDQTPYPK